VSAYTQRDYEAIEAAVLESPRGRWFLNEFARRNRAADTLMLLAAIRKLERGVAGNPAHQVSEELAAEQSRTEAADPGGALTSENLSYFEGDENLFVPETADHGRESGPARSLVVVGDDNPARKDAGEPESGAAPVSGPKGNPMDRIVFIRRASSRETSIPLADEADDPVATGKSQPVS
jgi:hypothetical protein